MDGPQEVTGLDRLAIIQDPTGAVVSWSAAACAAVADAVVDTHTKR